MTHNFIAKTFSGLEDVLFNELKQLEVKNPEIIKRGVKFNGDKAILYRSNYMLRTALRILKTVGEFDVTDEESLYERVKKIDWINLLGKNQTFVVHADVFHSQITNSQYIALKTKDAIADYFRERRSTRPSVNKDNPDVIINIHISHDKCTVSLDSSGDSLHKRGYRIAADKAPVNEVLAAGMIQLAGWNANTDFYDPMCGSGTIPIEAAMLAINIPAGYYRPHFSFQKWLDFDLNLWNEIKSKADASFKDIDINIYASDKSEKAIQIAQKNLRHTALHKDINIKKEYFDAVKPNGKNGTLIFNPPYGKRLLEKDIIKLYKMIGDTLKSNWSGHKAWIITSDINAAKFIGLKPFKKFRLYNGPDEVLFLGFELYEGSKKAKNQKTQIRNDKKNKYSKYQNKKQQKKR
jgi:putative N6-adenine-specific DNA methylase